MLSSASILILSAWMRILKAAKNLELKARASFAVNVAGTFNKGQSISFNVNQGYVLISERPTQVDLIGVDLNDTYADDLSASYCYYSPLFDQGNSQTWKAGLPQTNKTMNTTLEMQNTTPKLRYVTGIGSRQPSAVSCLVHCLMAMIKLQPELNTSIQTAQWFHWRLLVWTGKPIAWTRKVWQPESADSFGKTGMPTSAELEMMIALLLLIKNSCSLLGQPRNALKQMNFEKSGKGTQEGCNKEPG